MLFYRILAQTRGDDYHQYCLPECRVRWAQGNGLADPGQLVQNFLNFRRTDPVTRGLDHLIFAADKVQIALGVTPDLVTGPDRNLREW